MKKVNNIYAALLCAMIVSFTGCVEENLEPIVPARDGDEIIFGARAGFENGDPKTRTDYSGQTYTVKVGEKTTYFERIDWIDGDKIEIYSPEATNGPTSHYTITSFTTGDENAGDTGKGSDYAQIARIGDSALSWNGDGTHNFYAMYPSSLMFTDDPDKTVETGAYMKETMVYGIVPITQPAISVAPDKNKEGCYIAKPNMDFAYMVAKGSATRKDATIGLSFVPIVTAVEIELVNPTGNNSVYIGEIQISSKEQPITGKFTADLNDWEGVYPACTNDDSNTNETIQITTRIKDTNGNIGAVELAAGCSLKFTAFLLPGTNIQNLNIRVSSTGSSYIGKTLDGANIPKNLKTRIKNLLLPPEEEFIIDASKWMSQLPEGTMLKKLSLPGTGGSFSYGYDDVNLNEDTSDDVANPEWYMQQNLTLEQQWNLGIRAFEIISDMGWTGSAVKTLGEAPIMCNKTEMGPIADGYGNTVGDAYKWLLEKVKSCNTETAVIILTYQPVGNDPDRNASDYATSLDLMLDALEVNYAEQLDQIYNPDMTIKDAAGHVLTIARINQRDEEDAGSFTQATNNLSGHKVLLVDGCGTAKDRWGARGYKLTYEDKYGWGLFDDPTYTYNSINAYDISNSVNGTSGLFHTYTGNYVEYYMQKEFIFKTLNGEYTNNHSRLQNSGTIGVSRPAKGSITGLNFGFPTNTGNTCWFQEWARVADKEIGPVSWSGTGNSGTIYWFESYTEKLSNVTTTFDMAISDEYSTYVFVNSLCGYLIDEKNIPDSATPSIGYTYGGAAGNIKGLADKLNPAFYEHVLSSGMEQKTGPTGIILMDYVSDNPADGGAYYLPGTIIANNFKFDLGGSGSISGGGQGAGGNPGGTVPW